ncbi:MAG: AraC family transcriptional regulator [Eubacterium sp.]
MEPYDLISKDTKRNIFFNCIPFCIEKSKIIKSDHPHIHEFSQLTIVTGGRGKIIVNHHEKNLTEGCAYVIGSFTPHYLADVEDLEFINILFQADDLMKSAGTLKENLGFQTLFVLQASLNENQDLTNMVHLLFDELNYISEICDHLLEEVNHLESGYEIMVQSYFLILITFLSRIYEKNQSVDTKYQKFQKVMTYLEKHYNESISIEALAELAFLSERQFRRLFKEKYGLSPKQYCMNLQMKEACYLLKTSDFSINVISEKTGFDDANYFSRQFKKQIGYTPKEYRNLETF